MRVKNRQRSGLSDGLRQKKAGVSPDSGVSHCKSLKPLSLLGLRCAIIASAAQGSGSTAVAASGNDPRRDVKKPGCSGPSLLDGAARDRIIGAFALFVST